MAYTQQEILQYLQANGLPLNAYGIDQAVKRFNSTGGNVTLNDVGNAFGMDPTQTQAWMRANPASFAEMFGNDAIVQRPTNGVFDVLSVPQGQAMMSNDQGVFSSPSAGAQAWKYDPATQTYTSPTGKQVSISSLGYADPTTATYALGQMASKEGKNIDPWSAYPARTFGDWSADQYRGALTNDLDKIMAFDAAKTGGGLNQFMNTLPWLAGAALTAGGLSGALAPYEAGAAAAGSSGGAGGLLAGTQAPAPVFDAAMTPVGASSSGGAGGGGTYFGLSTAGIQAAAPGLTAAQAGAAASAAQAAAAAGGGQSAITSALVSAGVPAAAAELIGGKVGQTLIGAGLGAALTSGASGGSKQSGTTTSTQAPWEPMQPYLQGAAQAALSNYQNQRTMSPMLQDAWKQAQTMTSNQMNDPRYGGLRDWSEKVFTGTSGAFSPVGNTAGVSPITAQQVDPFGFQSAGAPQISVGGAFNRMGSVNPTQAYQSLLTGDVTNPYLSNIARDNFTMANRNLMENVMPGINSGASTSGQFGGSRQGIAQGLAISRMNQDVTQANNQMFGNAYQQAQGNMLSAAGQLGNFGMGAETQNAANTLNNNQFNATLGAGIAQNNANRALTADTTNAGNMLNAQQFNANLGLQNNNQRLSQMGSAVDWFNNANNMQNTAIKNNIDMSNYPNTYSNNALNTYMGQITPLGGMGSTTQQPYFTNPTNNMLGGAMMGSQIFKNIFS